MLVLVSALVFSEPAVQEALSDRVVLLEPGSAFELDTNACLDAIEAHGGGSGLGFERSPAGSGPPLRTALERSRSEPLLAVFWFDLSPERLSLYLYAPRSHALYVRELDRAEASDAALIEAVGLIAASTAEALRTGETLAMRKVSEEEWAAMQAAADVEPEPKTGPDAAVEPEPKPDAAVGTAATVDPEPPLRIDLGAGYRGASFNAAAPWQHGVAGRVAFGLGRGLVVEAGYAWMAPVDISASSRLRLTRHEPELAAGWRWVFGRFAVDAVGLASLEVDRWEAQGRGTRLRGRLGAAVRPAVEVGAGVFLEARLGARAAVNGFAFVLCDSPDVPCTDDARQVVASGWPVAPEAVVGVSYRFPSVPKK